MSHQSVLLNESIEGLAIKINGIYIDGTFGRGGHSKAILDQLGDYGRLIVIDKDLTAIAYAKELFLNEPRVTIVHRSFAQIKLICKELNVEGQVDGVLLDLGVSSPQLDNPERGFSFMQAGPLDMRMDVTQKLSAALFINSAPLEEMITVFRDLGEERFARRIANAIISARLVKPITTTDALAEIVKAANPKWEKHKHPATRVFQAIRIYINQELTDLTQALSDSIDVLAIGGRLSVISFHSLEDRIVKHFMRDQEQGEQIPWYIPVQAYQEPVKRYKRMSKAVTPSAEEIKTNNRSRSAVLRIGEKLA